MWVATDRANEVVRKWSASGPGWYRCGPLLVPPYFGSLRTTSVRYLVSKQPLVRGEEEALVAASV